MYFSAATWPGTTSDFLSLTLKRYDFSSKRTLLFCEVCGSLMAAYIHNDPNETDHIVVATGTLVSNEKGLIQVVEHIYVEDTRDGGATPWMYDLHGLAIPIRKGPVGSEELPANLTEKVSSDQSTQDELPLYCHCNSVNLRVRRGKYDANDKDLPFFANPGNSKSLANFDACHSCRTSTGCADITHWTFALLQNIAFPDGSEFPTSTTALKESKDPRLAPLKYYASSPDVQRYFCSNCSASLFYAADDCITFVNVAIGLLEADEGARAESWLQWDHGKMVWPDGVKGTWREALVAKVQANSENFLRATGRELPWVRRAAKTCSDIFGEE